MATRYAPSIRLGTCADRLKFLTLLNQAQGESSPQHASVMSLVRSQLARRASAPPPKPQYSTAPGPDLVPLLTRVKQSAHDNHAVPTYISTLRPRPLSELKGRRRVPTYVVESNGLPFLRVGKPQSPVLGRVLRQKGKKRATRTTQLLQLNTEELPFVALEDAWENRLRQLAEKEGLAGTVGSQYEATYGQSVKAGMQYLGHALSTERADMIARGRALLKIVDAERELAVKEKEERTAQRREAWEKRMAQEGTPV